MPRRREPRPDATSLDAAIAARRPHVIVYNRETHAYFPDGQPPPPGDRIPVFRGNGPREGERMGWAVLAPDGSLSLEIGGP